jgi:hypothetical protein
VITVSTKTLLGFVTYIDSTVPRCCSFGNKSEPDPDTSTGQPHFLCASDPNGTTTIHNRPQHLYQDLQSLACLS